MYIGLTKLIRVRKHPRRIVSNYYPPIEPYIPDEDENKPNKIEKRRLKSLKNPNEDSQPDQTYSIENQIEDESLDSDQE